MASSRSKDQFDDKETEQRMAAALRGAREVGHKPQSEMKLGKPRGKPAKSPKAKKAPPKRG
jgi:hypothetical protein